MARLDTLANLLGHILVSEGAEQARAIERFNAILKQDEVSFGDLRFRLLGEDNNAVFTETKERLVAALQENAFLRCHISAPILRKAIEASRVSYRWPEFVELLAARLPMVETQPQRTFSQIAKICGVARATVAMWHEGTAQVPDRAFELVQAMPTMPLVQRPSARARKIRKKPVPNFKWTKPVLERIALEFIAGASRDMLVQSVEQMTGITPDQNQLNQLLYNNGPPPCLDISVGTGPMQWGEAWLIGAALRPKGTKSWKSPILCELGLRKSVEPPADLNVNPDRVAMVRENYFRHMGDKFARRQLNSTQQAVVDYLDRQGNSGATISEMDDSCIPHSNRMADLERMGCVFSQGEPRRYFHIKVRDMRLQAAA